MEWQVVCFLLLCFYLQAILGQLRYSIPEETKKGFLVGNVAKDLGLNIRQLAVRKFRISSVNAQNFFSVNLDNGNLYVSDRIDRETICEMTSSCLLSLEAVAENPLSVFPVEVEIQDVNDNPPVFSKSVINLELSELTQPGTKFVLVNALDPDVGINSLQTYRISENQYFTLREKASADGSKYPELVLQKMLDREQQSSFEIILTAADGGQPVKTGAAVIKIIVSDINDNAPVFEKELYQIDVFENTPVNSLVIKLSATDRDEGLNGQVTYSFGHIKKIAQQAFTIDSVTGEIRTKGQLDFETTKSYEVMVEAEDGGGLVSHCKILIKIIDANDNEPEITLTSVTNTIPEDALPGTLIALINIRDIDSGTNGDVSCKITGSIPFEIISSSSNYYRLQTSDILDREETEGFNITITAADRGSPPLSTTRTIWLEVMDVNDNPPVFEQTNYDVYVPENKAAGSSLYKVQAFDPDLLDNGKITYSINNRYFSDVPISTYVSINSVTGVLYAQQVFDYEQMREFEFQITASDNGNPRLTSNVTVKIYVIDQNDNPPKILYPSIARRGSAFETVPLSSGKGHLVTKVVAVDADSGHNAWLSYEFLSMAEPLSFSIGQHSGEIRTLRTFGEKDLIKHSVVVMVKDHGTPPLSCTVTLNLVVAENFQQDVSEINTQSRNYDLSSNLNIYLVIALAVMAFLFTLTIMIAIIAKWRKSRTNHPKTFGYLPTDMYSQVGPTFPVNFNYASTLPYSLDTSAAVDSTENEFAYLKPSHNNTTDKLIDCDDSGIGISTVNNSPTTDSSKQDITSETLYYSVMEEADAGTLLGNVAKDLGIPLVAVFERSMQLRSTGSSQYFAVDQQSGNLTLAKTIDRENVCGSKLHCVLVAEVVLESPLELHRLEAEILDINDNSPTFSTPEQVIQITEFLAYPGARVPLEEAYDLDPGVNGVRQYNLSGSSYFSLSVKSHKDGLPTPELVIEKALDREERGSHHLILTAFDGGSPPKSGTSQITIIILDFNDNAPVFRQNFYKINLPENVPLNSVVVQLNATDLDEGLNAEVEYAFDSRTPIFQKQLFSLNPVTGVLSTNAMLDFESSKFYELTIKAKDKGTPQMEGSCLLQIEIGDVNDNLPEILLTSLLGQIPEDTNVGTTIGLFSVTDMDSGKNGEVRVFVSPDMPFKIKSFKDHYALIVDEPLDREKTDRYEIILTAVDMGSPVLSSQTTIKVNISDTNDNPPLVLNHDLNAYIPENNEAGHLLYTVSACDPDEGNNAMLTYSIVDEQLFGLPISSFVSINSASGDIYAQCSFDYEQIHVLKIMVEVEDSGDPRLSSNTTVFVFIIDINDNSPNLLYPKYTGDLTTNINLSKTVPVGYLVTKLSAVDSDSGNNAWLSYTFVESSDNFLFNLSAHSGEIRTVRDFLPTDKSLQKFVLAISDNGKPSLSLTVTILVALDSNSNTATLSNHNLFSANRTDVTLYLIISLVIVSLACLIMFVLLVVKFIKKELYLCQYPCWFLHEPNSTDSPQTFQPTLGFNMDGTLKYMEIRLDPSNPQSQCYRTYFTHSDNISLTLLKPLTFSPVKDVDSNAESLGITSLRDPTEHSQPNADWQLTQGQRPGPSGSTATVIPSALAVKSGFAFRK
ncbi:hypothetical protein AB205_0163040 [Aquarana catesbeiana]|uniref:Cadherin domain-containing protein n=1 Tax=Aquarana catesbeiana TaxID=8400 RepID=A0A2G9S161_AQUCT|nr:hypothetical protein AB205_0163040 [Aquarana catesbeiana]